MCTTAQWDPNPTLQTPSSMPWPWDLAIAPSPPHCHTLPKPISEGIGGWLIAVNRKHWKFPVGHVNETHHVQKACWSADVCGNDLPGFPDHKWTSLPSQKSSEAASYWQQTLIIRGSSTVLSSQKLLLPPTAEFKEGKLSKPKETAH